MPVTPKLNGELVDGAPIAASLFGHPPPRPIRHHQPSRRDVIRGLSERTDRTRRRRAGPAPLVPHQPGRTPEHRQIDQLDRPLILEPHPTATARTHRPLPTGLDMNPHRAARIILSAEHGHIAETDKQLTDQRRVNNHRGSPESDWLDTVRFPEPLYRARDPYPPITPPSNPKSQLLSLRPIGSGPRLGNRDLEQDAKHLQHLTASTCGPTGL